jgi:hypothetical protein
MLILIGAVQALLRANPTYSVALTGIILILNWIYIYIVKN